VVAPELRGPRAGHRLGHVSESSLDQLCVNTIRTLSMDTVQKANPGHPGTPMALAPLAYVLHDADGPDVILMETGSEVHVADAMEGFGASAPAKQYAHFGFTGESVAERARGVLDRVARAEVPT
jgi:transketolase